MKSDPARRDDTKYCEFHKDHGHRTDDCIQLKRAIEYLIRRGHLSRYVASEGQERVQPPPPHLPTLVQHQSPLGEIHVISRGFAGGGESSSARKALAPISPVAQFGELNYDAPKPGGLLTTRQPAENLYVSYHETHT